jgi:molybdopterin-guanine dinucleotide biosynthesis protein A
MHLRVLGAVIAGGRSRRFGSDKATADLDGRTLLNHAIDSLSLQTDDLVICGREVEGHICLPDRPMPGLGPLGGLAAALHHAANREFDGVLTSACDTPEVPADLAAMLAGSDAAVVIGQPLFGYWPARLSAELDEYLALADSLAVGDWVVRAGARRVRYPGEMANVNTVADLAALRTRRLLAA